MVNGTSSPSVPSVTPPPPKRSRPSRPRATPTKASVVVAPTPLSRPILSSSIEDDTSSMESNSTSNSIHSTMADLLDRCSSPPSAANVFDNEIRSCLNDLCHRIALTMDESLPSTSIIYNPIPSPVFKRKIEEQSSSNKRQTKVANAEEQTPKKKRNRSSGKKSSTDVTNVTVPITKKEETIEHEIPDIKPNISISNVMTSSVIHSSTDYVCEWDTCRK